MVETVEAAQMRKRLKEAIAWPLLSAMLAICSMGSIEAQVKRTPAAPVNGSLDVRVHPAEGELKPTAELLLYDARGRKTGKDHPAEKTYNEIPSSSYEYERVDDDTGDAPGPQTAIIYVRDPAAGEYHLRVIGKLSGEYDLEIAGQDVAGNPSRAQFNKVKISKGVTHHYVINYPDGPEAKLAVRSK
jgi:hypothetical protein